MPSELVGNEYRVWIKSCESGQSVEVLELVLDAMLTDEAIFERARQVRPVDRVGTRQLRQERRERWAIEHDTPLAIEHGKTGG